MSEAETHERHCAAPTSKFRVELTDEWRLVVGRFKEMSPSYAQQRPKLDRKRNVSDKLEYLLGLLLGDMLRKGGSPEDYLHECQRVLPFMETNYQYTQLNKVGFDSACIISEIIEEYMTAESLGQVITGQRDLYDLAKEYAALEEGAPPEVSLWLEAFYHDQSPAVRDSAGLGVQSIITHIGQSIEEGRFDDYIFEDLLRVSGEEDSAAARHVELARHLIEKTGGHAESEAIRSALTEVPRELLGDDIQQEIISHRHALAQEYENVTIALSDGVDAVAVGMSEHGKDEIDREVRELNKLLKAHRHPVRARQSPSDTKRRRSAPVEQAAESDTAHVTEINAEKKRSVQEFLFSIEDAGDTATSVEEYIDKLLGNQESLKRSMSNTIAFIPTSYDSDLRRGVKKVATVSVGHDDSPLFEFKPGEAAGLGAVEGVKVRDVAAWRILFVVGPSSEEGEPGPIHIVQVVDRKDLRKAIAQLKTRISHPKKVTTVS